MSDKIYNNQTLIINQRIFSVEIFKFSLGESYKSKIKHIKKYFSQRLLFLYGTLMTGDVNHHYLKNSTLLVKVIIKGYDMYNAKHYLNLY